MEWWEKLIVPLRRFLISVSSRVKTQRNGGGGGLLKLHNDVQTCGYEDVQVMWEMLRRSEFEMMDDQTTPTPAKRKQRPFWRAFLWSHNTSVKRHKKEVPILYMDKYTGKRAVGIAGRGSSLAIRNASNHEDQSVEYCNLLNCNTRHNSMKSSQVGSSVIDRYTSPFHSTMVGSSSKAYPSVDDLRKPHQEFQNPSSHKETVSAETNNVRVEKEVSEPNPSMGFAVDTSDEVGNYSVTSNTRTLKQIRNAKPASHGPGANASRYGLRSLGCASISDVLPSSCSSSDSRRNRRAEVVKGRSSDGECSTARGKSISGSTSGDNLGSQRNSLPIPSLSRSERPSAQPASRRTRYWPPSRDGITSVRTRRTINGDTRSELSEHGTSNTLSLSEPPVVVPQLTQTELSINRSSQPDSSQQSLHERAVRQNSFGRWGSRNENVRNRVTNDPEDGTAQPFNGLSIDRDDFRRFNMDGIGEVLLALERIEQDEELTYEQLLGLETNMFLGGLGLYDRHRDMRLDIDNMSYEELLALGEKMGTTNTALTEEELSNCLKRSCYVSAPPDVGSMGCGDDDVKCSVCQEEYVEGDEVGKLGCDHMFHVVCIHQWLRLKNWCPICKAHAAAS